MKDSTYELQLITRCRKGDSKAQELLYKHLYAYGMSICLRYTSQREEASEILNDSFLKIFHRLDQFDENKSFRAWIRRIFVNTAIDHYRKNLKHYYHQDVSEYDRESPSEDAIEMLSAEEILKMIQELPDSYRVTFNMFEIEGFSHEEISEKLQIPVGTSRSNLSRAKKKLREFVSKLFNIQYEEQ